MSDNWDVQVKLSQIEDAFSRFRGDQERFQERLAKLLSEIRSDTLDLVCELRTANQALAEAVTALQALDERFNPRTDIGDPF